MEEIKEQPEELRRRVYLSYCYDFYGSLLKTHNREIFEDYVLNDMSLGEIAAERGITRQGIYDIVKRCSKRLEDYEEKLKLVEKFQQTKERLKEIEKIAGQENSLAAQKIVTLAEEIYDML